MESLKSKNGTTKAEAKLRRKLGTPKAPAGNDPIDTLRILVRQHKNTSRMSVAVGHMGLTEVTLRSGETVKRDIPPDVSAKLKETSSYLSKEAMQLKADMAKALKGVPIYETFLKNVSGCGPVLSAYLATEVDIRGPLNRRHDGVIDGVPGIGKAGEGYKPSQLRRFCGLAVIDGHLERLSKGKKRAYNVGLRTQLYLMFVSIWKNAAQHKSVAESKYYKIWLEAKHRDLHKAGVEAYGTKEDGSPKHRRILDDGKVVSWDGHAHSYGWHKAADVFIEDLYIVWRAMEGLPVWPSYYAAKLGYEHGGKISVNAPKMLTLEEALELVK